MMTIQPLSPEDAPAVAAMRQATAAHKGDQLGPEARPMFDAMFAATPAAADVRVEAGTVGGIAGFWLRPAERTTGRAHALYSRRRLCARLGAGVHQFRGPDRRGAPAPMPLSRTTGSRPNTRSRQRSTMRSPPITVSSPKAPNGSWSLATRPAVA